MPLGQIGLSREYRSQVRNEGARLLPVHRRGYSGRSESVVTEQRVQRRLAAILAADVVGYSALMERAEEATYAEFERLKRELIEPSLSPGVSGWLITALNQGEEPDVADHAPRENAFS